MMIPVLALAWELPAGLELLSVDGDHVTVKDTRTGIMDSYLIEGEPVINGWTLEPTEDSLVFELVADLNMFLIANLKSYDFLNDGCPELIGTDLMSDFNILFLENTGNFNFSEVNRIISERILYDMGDGDSDGLIDILSQWQRSMYIYEQENTFSYSDSCVWRVTPLTGSYRVWPKYTDLDGDNIFEVSHNNHTSLYYYIAVNENTGDNIFGNFTEIQWPYGSPGDFTWGDYDGDGFIEIAGGSGAGYLSVFENVADDSFEIVWQEPFGHPNLKIHKSLGDVNGNGFLEWVSGSHDFSAGGFFFRVYEATGNNIYEQIYYDSLPGNPWYLGGAAAGDVDGDGINEFIFSSNANVGLYKYNSLTGWMRVWLLENLQGTVMPFLVDTDGDGLCEIIINSDAIPGFTRIYHLVLTAIEDLNTNVIKGVNIFPNPANDRVLIDLSEFEEGNMTVNVFDIMGRKVFSREAVASGQTIIWNLAEKRGKMVGSGVYYVRIANQKIDYVKKITILK
ncbi:MAG: T9SS type A sorting domain-containing protein [Deltaproteobacteria bacterium]|nr:T9SS type A sorting domain-containing protein [Deltaproteobacteria bacterium]